MSEGQREEEQQPTGVNELERGGRLYVGRDSFFNLFSASRCPSVLRSQTASVTFSAS